MEQKIAHVSLGKRPRTCRSFKCLGTKPNWEDYSPAEQDIIRAQNKIYYPSQLFEDLFRSLGKTVFPDNYYRFMGNKIKQTQLFKLLEIPHPRTRLYYGKNRLRRICREYSFPFIAKTPVGSSQGAGVWLIKSRDELAAYLKDHQPAYIQEYFEIDRDLRVVIINNTVVHAYWRIQKEGEFRSNVSRGASISYEGIPSDALDFARTVAQLCGFGEVGLDICRYKDTYYVLEANMVFGLEGFRRVGMDIYQILSRLGDSGQF